MKVGVIVLCRYSSSRLPGKILKKIKGKPILQYIIERINLALSIDKLIVATSEDVSDNPIYEYCINNNISCFRGSLFDVARRFLDCATQYDLDYAIRINGDNLFVDSSIIEKLANIAVAGNYDFVTNVKGRTFPTGMSVEVVKTSYYKEVVTRFHSNRHREHVTLYLYENETSGKHYYYTNEECKEAAGLNLAIDTKEDFIFAQHLIEKMGKPHTTYNLTRLYQLIKG